MTPEYIPEPPIVKVCVKCQFDFECYDRSNAYADWCCDCFFEIPAKLRFPATTPADLEEIKARQAKTRQSLKQRALDKKNRVGKTTSKKKEGDDRAADEDSLIFNETGE